ncbi:MAG: 50S ribosomal protein L29 [Bdellovibrionales bacterium]|nr:50S ribosomal protein L29 [Bdellovibrionales bacterium]
MSKAMKALKNLSANELVVKTRELEKTIFDTRMKKVTGQLADSAMIWRLRKDLARVKTLQTAANAKGKK